MPENPRIKRKEFLARCGSTILGLGLGVSCSTSENRPASGAQANPPPERASDKSPVVAYRTLGRSKIKVTEIGFGASRTMDPTLISYAFEKGMNFFDTGRAYYNGQNERLVGKIFKDKRQQVVINSKIKPDSLERMRRDLETSLSALETDYIDCLLIHGASRPEHIQGEETIEFFSRAREEGKIRTFGFSSHSNFIKLLSLAAEKPFHEVIMVPYNFLGRYTHMLGGSKKEWDAEELEKAIKKCGETGVDFISMKGCSGGYMKDEKGRETYQAALKWILRNPYMKTTATAMGNFQEIEEDATAMGGGGLGQAEWQLLDRYASRYGKSYCRMCGNCEGQCPAGVKVAEVNRLHMYAVSYGEDMKHQAHLSYSALGAGSAAACESCETCTVRCIYGLPLHRKLKEAHAVLS